MAGTGPQIPNSPLELLTNDGTRQPSILHNVWGYLIGGGLGFGASIFALWSSRKPLTAGLPRTLACGIIGAFIGNYLDQKKEEFYAEKDAFLRHYVQLHPEDFQPPERKKYAAVLEEWTPIR